MIVGTFERSARLALIRTADKVGAPLLVLRAVEDANQRQKQRAFDKLRAALGGSVAGCRIAVWGLAFKPGTDDMREAPSLTLIDALLAEGAAVCAHDPAAMSEARRRLGGGIDYAETNYDALTDADALVVMTDWNEYRNPDFARILDALRRDVVIDTRNLYDPLKMKTLGFTYASVGREVQG